MPIEATAPPISGTINCFVHDNNGVESTILSANLPWSVHVDWSVNNAIMIVPTMEWVVRVFLESIGPGAEKQLGSSQVVLAAGGPSQNYTVHVNVSSDPSLATPVTDPVGTSGIYKLVTVLTLRNGTTPMPIAGFHEGPVIQFMS